MWRFAIILCGVFFLMTASVMASSDRGAFKNEPPLTGDMMKLRLYPAPEKIPEVVLFSAKDGGAFLSGYRGKIVVMNLWATWCPPCVEELPSLNALQFAMDPDKVAVVTISLDTTGPEKVKQYLEDNNLEKLPPLLDTYQEAQKLDALKDAAGVPVTLILDPQMRVLARLSGPADWSGRSARAVLDYYVANFDALSGK